MLVLARKSKEIIRIGETIVIKVLSIRNGQVKLGIEAPREIRVTRAEREEGPRKADQKEGGNGEAHEADEPRQ
jgi:carbon storage regulator